MNFRCLWFGLAVASWFLAPPLLASDVDCQNRTFTIDVTHAGVQQAALPHVSDTDGDGRADELNVDNFFASLPPLRRKAEACAETWNISSPASAEAYASELREAAGFDTAVVTPEEFMERAQRPFPYVGVSAETSRDVGSGDPGAETDTSPSATTQQSTRPAREESSYQPGDAWYRFRTMSCSTQYSDECEPEAAWAAKLQQAREWGFAGPSSRCGPGEFDLKLLAYNFHQHALKRLEGSEDRPPFDFFSLAGIPESEQETYGSRVLQYSAFGGDRFPDRCAPLSKVRYKEIDSPVGWRAPVNQWVAERLGVQGEIEPAEFQLVSARVSAALANADADDSESLAEAEETLRDAIERLTTRTFMFGNGGEQREVTGVIAALEEQHRLTLAVMRGQTELRNQFKEHKALVDERLDGFGERLAELEEQVETNTANIANNSGRLDELVEGLPALVAAEVREQRAPIEARLNARRGEADQSAERDARMLTALDDIATILSEIRKETSPRADGADD